MDAKWKQRRLEYYRDRTLRWQGGKATTSLSWSDLCLYNKVKKAQSRESCAEGGVAGIQRFAAGLATVRVFVLSCRLVLHELKNTARQSMKGKISLSG